MFELKDIKTYLSEVLGIENVDELISKADKLEFLTTILQRHCQVQPFQNVTFLCKDYENRCRKTWEEVKLAMFRKEGGVCFDNHYIFYEILKTLEYEVSVVPVCYFNNMNHICLLIRNVVHHGDLYLLEAGCGYPTFQPICLDFDKESPIFNDSFLEYKYIKHDGKVKRLHGKGDKGLKENTMIGNKDKLIDGWREVYVFSVEDELPNIELLYDFMDKVLKDTSCTPFHSSIRWICFPEFRAKILVNQKVMMENDEHVLVKEEMKNDEEIIEAMVKFSPVLSLYIENALINFHSSKK